MTPVADRPSSAGSRGAINFYAGLALSVSSLFLIIMGILVNSPMLFYMATAVAATLGAAHFQAWLAVRYLRFERFTAPAVRVGETVTMEIVVWSERQLKRPLVTIRDHLPGRLITQDETPSVPVAPSFDQPIRTRYSFRPMRRGRFRWERLTVHGTDALGLVRKETTYVTEPVELEVYPSPLPFPYELSPLIGWGASDLDSGRRQGAGLEPRGVREYVPGDPLRYIHWRSTARRDRLMVKEFETGSGVTLHLILQRTQGTEFGDKETSTFEAFCGHALTIATDYAKKGAMVIFPVHEPLEAGTEHPEARERTVKSLLTDVNADVAQAVSQDVLAESRQFKDGDTVVIFLSVEDPMLPGVLSGLHGIKPVVLLYDPAEYVPAGTRLPNITAANDPRVIAELERAGAQTFTLTRREVKG